MSEPAVGDEPNELQAEPVVLLPVDAPSDAPSSEELFPEVVRVKRGHPLAAWLVIGVFVLAIPALGHFRAEVQQAGLEGNRASLLVLQIQSKVMVGYHELFR